jgi:hypothetical protein
MHVTLDLGNYAGSENLKFIQVTEELLQNVKLKLQSPLKGVEK